MRRPRKRAQLSSADELQLLERALDLYLEDCFAKGERAEVNEFASYLGLARQYVNRRFSAVTGEPVVTLMRRKQLEYAKQLLRATDLSNERIATASAFGSGWTFYRLFKAAFGITPGEFRDEATKNE